MATYAFVKPRNVFMRAYVRLRLGRIEHVCQHWRSLPYLQLNLTLS